MNWVAVMIALTRFVKKSESILLCWPQVLWAGSWDILFMVFSPAGHMPAPNRLYHWYHDCVDLWFILGLFVSFHGHLVGWFWTLCLVMLCCHPQLPVRLFSRMGTMLSQHTSLWQELLEATKSLFQCAL